MSLRIGHVKLYLEMNEVGSMEHLSWEILDNQSSLFLEEYQAYQVSTLSESDSSEIRRRLLESRFKFTKSNEHGTSNYAM